MISAVMLLSGRYLLSTNNDDDDNDNNNDDDNDDNTENFFIELNSILVTFRDFEYIDDIDDKGFVI